MGKTEATLARPPVVSQTEWDAALTALLEREQTVAAAMHELAAARKRMPMVRVEHDYAFEGPDGRRSLPELFDGRSQLILYRFFFEEGVDGWPDAGCVGCSSVADGIPELGLLHARDITFAMASPAPQANLRRYAERMGWTDVPWYTIRSERFSADFGVDEWFGFNVFLRDGNDVYRTYFLQHGAMVQWIGSLWSLWSLTPYGGQSDDEDLPEGWPRAPGSFWFRRHDEFDDPPPSARGASTRTIGPSGWRTPSRRTPLGWTGGPVEEDYEIEATSSPSGVTQVTFTRAGMTTTAAELSTSQFLAAPAFGKSPRTALVVRPKRDDQAVELVERLPTADE